MYTADVASVADSITLGRAAAPSGWRSRPGSWRRPRGEGSEAEGTFMCEGEGAEMGEGEATAEEGGRGLNGSG